MKPSLFTSIPWDSTTQNFQSEMIAKNIMVILSRTGDVFRELSWEEYKQERLKDGQFSEGEKQYFDKMCYLAIGEERSIQNFCKDWTNVYIDYLKKNQK